MEVLVLQRFLSRTEPGPPPPAAVLQVSHFQPHGGFLHLHIPAVLTETPLFLADMIPKARLGKRSPLGALVTSTSPGINLETGETVVTMAVAGQQATSRADGHLGLKVSAGPGC